jgi:hypothetical protein
MSGWPWVSATGGTEGAARRAAAAVFLGFVQKGRWGWWGERVVELMGEARRFVVRQVGLMRQAG